MSDQSVESILTKAMSDPAFADLLFSNLEKAVTGYDLTAEEIGNLKNMSRAEFDKAANGSTEERKSFGLRYNHNELILSTL